jgi:hypothetical protein
MQELFNVMKSGFIFLQVCPKKKVQAGDELFCQYKGTLWFDLITSDMEAAQPFQGQQFREQ